MTTTTPLTTGQASLLSNLSTACVNLRHAAKDLQQRAANIHERAAAGHHLDGFDSDIIGQAGREVQHHASTRAALILAVRAAGIEDGAAIVALTSEGQFRGQGRFFREGETFPVTPEEG